jgi:hypothetical protein
MHQDETDPAHEGCLCEAIPSCADELATLADLSGRLLVNLTGPIFSSLEPAEAASALLAAAVDMPRDLRLRTMHLAVSLLHTEDWSADIDTAVRHGDRVAEAILDLMRQEPLPVFPPVVGGYLQ